MRSGRFLSESSDITPIILNDENYVVDGDCFQQSIQLLNHADQFKGVLQKSIHDPNFKTKRWFLEQLFNKVNFVRKISDKERIVRWCNDKLTSIGIPRFINNILEVIIKKQMGQVECYLANRLLPILREELSQAQKEQLNQMIGHHSASSHERTIGTLLHIKNKGELLEKFNHYCGAVTRKESQAFLSNLIEATPAETMHSSLST